MNRRQIANLTAIAGLVLVLVNVYIALKQASELK